MFERWTERARHVVVSAQHAAREFEHNYIGTEHLLLGLLDEGEGLAARVLGEVGVTREQVAADIERMVGRRRDGWSDELQSKPIPFTPRAKKVCELALREALSLGHNYIGTEHVLLGIVRENEGVAARILLDRDVDSEKIRNEAICMLSGPGGRRRQRAPKSTAITLHLTRDAARWLLALVGPRPHSEKPSGEIYALLAEALHRENA